MSKSKDISALKIPHEVFDKIIPNQSLSILSFLRFPFPAVALARGNSLPTISDLDPTTTNLNEITTFPIPSREVVNQLLDSSEDLDHSHSVICSHVQEDIRLPLWILSYWTKISAIRPCRDLWSLAEENLQILKVSKQRTNDTVGLTNQVLTALSCTPWSGNIQGFSSSITIDHLTTYLSKKWFSDEHENQMLYLLRQELNRSLPSSNSDILETYFFRQLAESYKHDTYAIQKNTSWLRKKGQELANSIYDRLFTIINIADEYWVAVVVDFELSEILYGDSMGGTIDDGVDEVLTWWTHHHTGHSFMKGYLPTTRQRDGFSCGILAWNALAAHALPGRYSLMDAASVADERLRMFLEIVKRHNTKVRTYTFSRKIHAMM